MTVIRELLTVFGLDFDGAAFRRANTAVEELKGAAGRLAVAVGAGWVANEFRTAVVDVIDLGSAINDTAAKLGIGTRALQELQFATGLSGVSAESLTQALGFLGRTAGQAGAGSKEALHEFSRLGISLRGSDGQLKTTDALLGNIADAMARARSDNERLRISAALLGRGNSDLITALKGGSAAFGELRQEAEDLGGVLDDDLIAAADDAGDSIDRVKFVARGLKASLAKELLPDIKAASSAIIAWYKANRRLIVQRMGEAVRVVLGGIRAFGEVVRWAAEGATALTQRLGGLLPAMRVLGIAVGLIATRWVGAWLLMNAGPLLTGAVVLGLVAVIAILADEIIAMFTDTDGFFEKWSGHWLELADQLDQGIDWEKHPYLSLVKAIAKYAALAADSVDRLSGFIAETLTPMEFSAGDLQNLDTAASNAIRSRNARVGASPGAIGVASTTPAITNNVEVTVDASGQSLGSPEELAGHIRNGVAAALDDANRRARDALVPALPVARGSL